MLVFDIRQIVHKEFVLGGETFPHIAVAFYGDYVNMWEDFALNFATKELAVAR
jgi:hypothetical protein